MYQVGSYLPLVNIYLKSWNQLHSLQYIGYIAIAYFLAYYLLLHFTVYSQIYYKRIRSLLSGPGVWKDQEFENLGATRPSGPKLMNLVARVVT